MYAGRIVEQAPAAELFTRVRMPYTQALFEAIPRLERPAHAPLPVIGGRPPDLATLPPGCAFAPRCRRRRRRLPGRRAAAGRARARPPLGLLASRAERRRPMAASRNTEADRLAAGHADLVQEFAHATGGVKGGVVHAVSGVSFDVRRRGDARHRRRDRLGQVDAGPLDLCRRRGPSRARSSSAAPTWPGCAAPGCSRPGGTCRWCSRTRSARWTRSGRCGTWSRSRWSPTGSATGRARRAPGRRGARAGRARPGGYGSRRPARAVRRPGPAGRHRPRARPRPGADHLRRGRSRPSTCSSRPRSSTCSSGCAPSSACPTCSSRTTSPWSSRSATGWR